MFNVTAPKAEFKLKFFVAIVPNPASANVVPEFIVTEFVPFSVPPTVTDCVFAAFAVSVMSAAFTVPAAVDRLAVVAVTFKLVPTVPGFSVTVLAAESDTTAELPAFNVKLVAVVSAMLTFAEPAVALKLAVVKVPTVVT